MTWRIKDSVGTALKQLQHGDLAGLWDTMDQAKARDDGGFIVTALASMAAQLGDRQRAVNLLTGVAARYPRSGFVHTALARYYYELGEVDAAVDAYRRATEVEPKDYEGWYGLGCMLDARGDHESALKALDRAASLNPKRWEIFLQLGDTRCALGRFSTALAAYDQGLEIEPDNGRLRFHRARTLGTLGQFEDAQQAAPRSVVRELGELREVRRVVDGRFLVARFWASDDVLELFEGFAQRILDDLASSAVSDTACVDQGTAPVRIVSHQGMLVVCDAEPDRALQADRFLELNEAVSLLYAQHLAHRSTGLDERECRWTDLVRIDEKALAHPSIVMRRNEPLAGDSGWVLTSVEAAQRAAKHELKVVPVFELRRYRPELTRFMSLPPGVEVQVHGTEVRELRVANERDPDTDVSPLLH